MDKYIFIRDYRIGDRDIPKGSILIKEEVGATVYTNEAVIEIVWQGGMMASLLLLDETLFLRTHDSFPYQNWLREKETDLDNDGETLLYSNIRKCPETMIMFLRDSGLTNTMIMTAMFGKGNKYGEYLSLFKQQSTFA